jgi:hypothetical protein
MRTLTHARVLLLPALLIIPALVLGQTYPPRQYPPGQYPPAQYPPNTVPVTLPGGGTIGVPAPEIKLPKRKKKDKKKNDDELEVKLSSIDGTLRRLGEKELLIETAAKRVVRFRLLAKTQFRNTKGEAIRDSLLRPGDQLAVKVNPDDEETALRVVLVRAGTEEERAAASQPVDSGAAAAPASGEAAAAHPSFSEDKGPPRPATGSAPTPPVDELILEARQAADSFTEELPDFLVQQVTIRYYSSTNPPQWQAADIVTAEVACANGKEEYRNISINGRPTQRPVEKTGSWSTGEYVTTLQDVLSPRTAARFVKRGPGQVGNRDAVVYDFTVEQANSHWRIVADERHNYAPAYKGSLWIDRETHRVLRIEQRTIWLPDDFPVDKAESKIEYGLVRIDGKNYLLPTESQNTACARGTLQCSENVISFRNYRKFSADSDITYGRFRTPLGQ